MIKIAHIVNPIVAKEKTDLFIAQPITFESMRIAKDYAQANGLDVELYSCLFEEDEAAKPEGFLFTPYLDRSILDFGEFKEKRKLPILKDILDRLYQITDADYLIYTNADIALMPNFYLAVNQLIKEGYDAFVINRRTISSQYYDINDLPLMYAQIGEKHKGHDCFIFNRKAYSQYALGKTCIGASLVGRNLVLNLICNSTRFKEFQDLHLTFHIGDDRAWRSDRFKDYTLHNLEELKLSVEHYREKGGIPEHPLMKTCIERLHDPDYWLGKKNTSHSLNEVSRKKPRLKRAVEYLYRRL